MKKLFFLMIAVVASLLPQGAWADAVLYGTTLTITTTAAGQVDGYVSSLSAEQKAAVTKIVLNGYFNDADLVAIKGNDGSGSSGAFTGVAEVDMAEAQFVMTSSGAPDQAYYLLYNTGVTPPAGTTGDRAIVGGTLYKSAQNGEWNELNYVPTEGTAVEDNINTSVTTGYAIGTYGKNSPVTWYVQMQVTGASWSGPFNKGYNGFEVPSSATQLTASSFANEATVLAAQLDNYYGGQWVYFNRYFKTQYNSSTGQYDWVEGTETDWNSATGNKYDDPSGVDFSNMSSWYASQGNNPEGNVMLVKVYYQKQDGSKSWVNDTQTDPGSAIDMSAYEYAYRDDHKDGYTNGQWVKLTKWRYYQLQADGTWRWEPVSSYNDGEGHYINKKYPSGTDMSSTSDGLPNAANQYAVLMGSNSGDGEFYYNGSNWIDPAGVSNTPHYVDMKFTYWSATLQKAITSKYADEDINPDIFLNCNALTNVDFKAGVVKGFTDHTTPANSLTVNIGKNVTKIASNAFIRCTALKTLTFDAGAGSVDAIDGKTYPLALEISGGAFQDCENLKSVTIPNRVTVIGNDAFKEAGNAGDSEFTVTFQRRYTDDTKTTAIDGWQEGMNLTIGTDAFAYCSNLKEISLPIRMTSMGDGIFQNSGLEKYEIREDIEEALVTTIPSNAFLACNLKVINIPRSVTEIESGAFSNTPTIQTIRFQKQLGSTQEPLIIRTGAFSGGDEDHQELKDVYVDFTPEERLVVCEYDAFNYTSMVGQTNVANAKFARLHFPDESWNYYQGDWKRGLAFRQTNLTAYKDGYTGKFGGIESEDNCTGKSISNNLNYSDGFYRANGSDASSAYDRLVAPANGWQQFAYSDTEIEIEITRGSFMRTYSTNTAYVIPTFAEDDVTYNITAGDPMFKIHRIIAFSDGWAPGDDPNNTTTAQNRPRIATAREVVQTDANGRIYIPKETGLMMVGNVNADYVAYFADADFTSMTQTTYPYDVSKNDPEDVSTTTNLLYPTCIDELNLKGDGTSAQTILTGQPSFLDDTHDRIVLNSTIPYPYYNVSEVLFRLFGYASSVNKFIRTEGATSTRDKAYLKLPAAWFHWTNEYNGSEGSGSGSGVEPPSSPAAHAIELDFSDVEEHFTGIKLIDQSQHKTDSDAFFTLEGVKLNAQPTQRGIYIHNGRKVVIK